MASSLRITLSKQHYSFLTRVEEDVNHVRKNFVWSAKAFKVQSGPQNCDSKKVLNLLKCKVCVEVPYVEKAKTKFRYRPNNYKSKHRAFRKGNRRNYSTFTIDSMATVALKFENL